MGRLHDRDSLRMALSQPASVCRALDVDGGARMQPNGLMIRCPWHDDTNPSCSITTAPDGALRVKCFACGAAGDVFALIAKMQGLDVTNQFPDVLAAAAKIAGQLETNGTSAAKTQTPKSAAHRSALPTDTFDAMARAMLAAAPLNASSDVTTYLSGRRLLQHATDQGWGALPTEKWTVQSVVKAVITAVGLDAWTCSGMCSQGGTLKYPDNVVIIPWRDADGRISTLQRRTITEDSVHKYVFATGRAPMVPYGVEKIAANNPELDIAFVEGAVDAIAYSTLCERHGKKRVVLGVPGASSWHSAWAAYAKGRVAHIALDADEAGDRGAVGIADELHRAGALRVLRQRPRGAKDWAELLERSTP